MCFNEAPPAKGGEFKGTAWGNVSTHGFNEAPPAKGGESPPPPRRMVLSLSSFNEAPPAKGGE